MVQYLHGKFMAICMAIYGERTDVAPSQVLCRVPVPPWAPRRSPPGRRPGRPRAGPRVR